jgi:phospholipid/cholesterol/gamma-HCH transport system substrate-binding protein
VERFSPEAKVGIFVLAGIALLVYFSVRIGALKMPGEEEGYRVSVLFESIAGLQAKAKVRYAGIPVGIVEQIDLVNDRARVVLLLRPDVRIRRDAAVEVGTMGLLGEKYINIRGGTPQAPYLKDGDTIEGAEPVSIDQIVGSINAVGRDIKAITESFRDVVGTEEGKLALHRILENIENLTRNLSEMVAANRRNMDEMLENIRVLTADLRELSQEHKADIGSTFTAVSTVASELEQSMPQILRHLESILLETDRILSTNRSNVDMSMDNIRRASARLEETMESLRNITERLERGEGSLGKLLTDETTHENLNTSLTALTETLEEANGFLGRLSDYETRLGYRGDFLAEYSKWRNVVSVQIQPKQDKYYLLEFVDSPFGKRTIQDTEITTESSLTGTEHLTIHKEEIKDTFLFSMQIAKQLRWLTVRGGLIESTGGVGADLDLFRGRLRLSLEGFDFGDDERRIHLRALTSVRFADYFQLGLGWDDPLNDETSSYFISGGLSFADEDFKFLLGLIPLASGS